VYFFEVNFVFRSERNRIRCGRAPKEWFCFNIAKFKTSTWLCSNKIL